MKKRMIAGLLSAVLVLVTVPASAFAANGIVLKAGHVEAECKAGTEISVPVEASLNAGYGAGTVDITWDQSALTLKSVKYTDIAPDNDSAEPTDKGSYRACFGSYTAKENYTATGNFFTMTFTVTATAKPGDYAIILDHASVFDAQIQPVTASVRAGSVSLSGEAPADGLHLKVGTAEADAGEAAEIRVPVQAAKNSGFAAGSVDLLWDPDVLTLSKVEFSELAPDNSSAEIVSDGNYRIAFGSFLASADTTKTGTLFTLVFSANADTAAGTYPIVLGNYSVLNAAAERIPVTVRSGAVILKEQTTAPAVTTTTAKLTTTVTTSTTAKQTTTVTTTTTAKPTTTVTTSTTSKPTTMVTTSTTAKPTTTVTTSTTVKPTTTVITSTTAKPTTTITTSTTAKPTTTVTTSTTAKPTTTVTTSTTAKPTTTVTTSTTAKPTTTVTTSTTAKPTTTVTTSTTAKPTTTVTTSTTAKPTTTVTTSTTAKPTTTVTTSTTAKPTTTVTTSTTAKPTTTVTTSTTAKPTTTVTTSTTAKPTTTVTTSTTAKPITTVTTSTTAKPTTTVTTSTTAKPTTTVTTSTTAKPTTTVATSTTAKPTTTVTTSTTAKPTTTVTTSTTAKPTTTVTTTTTEKTTTTVTLTTSVTGTTVTTSETQQTLPDFLLGDVNDDGSVTVEDAQLTLIEYVIIMSGQKAGFTEKQKLAGDINGDKQITVEDAQNILLYYVRGTLSGQAVTWEEVLGRKAPAKSLPGASAMQLRNTAYHRKIS